MAEQSVIIDLIEKKDLVANFLSRFLDSNGNGTGVIDMATTADQYFIAPPESQRFVIHEIIIKIFDNGSFGTNSFGNAPILTNGVKIDKLDVSDTSIHDFLDGQPITANPDWGFIIGHTILDDLLSTAGKEVLVMRWNTLRQNGIPIVLNGELSEKLNFNVQDNLTSLQGMFVFVKGFITGTTTL